jgi:hypothetical protein
VGVNVDVHGQVNALGVDVDLNVKVDVDVYVVFRRKRVSITCRSCSGRWKLR